jgi:hypothetical protein
MSSTGKLIISDLIEGLQIKTRIGEGHCPPKLSNPIISSKLFGGHTLTPKTRKAGQHCYMERF